ncbi:MAG TPA: hypothetical protein PLL32_03050 [Anaeromyxobacteraceae bacterium]|nr:hypothetical protein [Anaeromyxobacteraceae bacterium]
MTELEAALRREHARAVRYREAFSLLLVDRPPTDEVLARLRDATRLCDAVLPVPGQGRVAVLLPETPLQGALQVGERLAALLADLPPQGEAVPVGVATHTGSRPTDAAGLFREAARALEQARSKGGGVHVAPVR